MFYGCSNLLIGVEIPTTIETASKECMKSMFEGCASFIGPINNSHKLSITNLANNCYDSMFYGCCSLSAAPYLPATVSADACYKNMFAYAINCVITNICTISFYRSSDDKSYSFAFMFVGNTGVVELRYLEIKEYHHVSSDDFGWMLVQIHQQKKVTL